MKKEIVYGRLVAFGYVLLECLKLLTAKVFSFFLKEKDVWLIADRGDNASDNGYFFFKYLKNSHPEINAKFVISKESSDYSKVVNYEGDIVQFKSFNHYVLFCKANCLVSSFFYYVGYSPCPHQTAILNQYTGLFKRKKQVCLKHGVTKDFFPELLYKKAHVDMICCTSKQEYEYIRDIYGYPPDVLQLTGFCRFDSLSNTPSRTVLVIPTWRNWLDKGFPSSGFFQEWVSLLNDQELDLLLSQAGLSLVFYPHYLLQPFIGYFKDAVTNPRIIVADQSYDLQSMINHSLVMITDYSSVFFDFAYLEKPVIFYQFDKAQFNERHHSEGYFKYDEGFGPVTKTKDELISELRHVIENDFRMDEMFRQRVDDFFWVRDSHNCDRVFDAIISLGR